MSNYQRDVAAIARRARERAEQKREQTPAEEQPPKELPREDPYSRLLRRLREDNDPKKAR
jgi:hypothetical protein